MGPTDTEETRKARRNGFLDRSVVSVSHVERARAENAAEQVRKPAWIAGTMELLEVRQTTGDEGDDEDSDKEKDGEAPGPGRRFMVLFSGVALLGDIAHDMEATVSFSNIQTQRAP